MLVVRRSFAYEAVLGNRIPSTRIESEFFARAMKFFKWVALRGPDN